MKKIVLNNFRGFKDQEFNFSKVNILIGENSGGKSSFLKFLLALKQTILEKDINLKLFGRFVDLGNYQEVIYYHDNKEQLSFSFEFNSEEYLEGFYFWFILQVATEFEKGEIEIFRQQVKKYIGEGISCPTTVKYTLNKDLDKHNSIKIEFSNEFLGSLLIEHNEQAKTEKIEDIIGESPKCKITFNSKNEVIVLEDIEYAVSSFLSLVSSNSLKKSLDEKGKDSSVYHRIAFLLVIQNYLTFSLSNVNYVNPLLAGPKRIYDVRDYSENMEMNLEKMVTFLGDSKRPLNERKKIGELLNEALKLFGLADSISLNTENPRFYELRAKIKDLESNITDIGYGVSVQLPILFQVIRSQLKPIGEVILIEQPELHLHPRLQAKFIDTILKIGSKNTYFIETHSEHIIRKLQSIVKNETTNFKREDITIHYFRRENEKFVITSHLINENWKIVPNFPSGFFDSSYQLSKELL